MTPNADLVARYSDLLDGEVDARLLNVVGDLDALFAAVAPPRYLATQLEEAVVAHLSNEPEGETRTSVRPVGALAPFAAGTPNGRRAPRRWQTLVATAAAFTVVALLAVLLTSLGHGPGGIGGGTPDQRFARLGGVRIVAVPLCTDQTGNCGRPASLQREVSIIQARIGAQLNVPEVIVRLQSDDSILIELPGVNDDAPVLALLAQGCVDIIDTGSTALPVGYELPLRGSPYPTAFTCASLDSHSISVGMDPQSQQPVVTFAFTGADQARFAEYTRTHIGGVLTIALDGRVIESATIQSEISGQGQITGLPDLAAARTLAAFMKYSALPMPLKIIAAELVPPGGPQACLPATPTPTMAGPTPPATPTATPPPTPTPGSGAKISFAASDVGCPTPTPPPTPTPGAQSTPTWTSTGEVIVPDVLGLPVAQALNELTAVNLRKVITINQPSTLPVGYVFRTDPPAGASVPPSDPILVYVSTGAATPTPTPTAAG
ncbi:MAG TPA: PASTA domain-containing protein [Ktedonobacterales bacterium]|nr:PASTA domain-containing protein [Ktedonobacterales bacterium]